MEREIRRGDDLDQRYSCEQNWFYSDFIFFSHPITCYIYL